jgi:hypothetical protein
MGLRYLTVGAVCVVSLAARPPQPSVAPPLIISEFRLQGPLGAQDEFIEIYNASPFSHTVTAVSGTGYGIAASDGVTRCTIPNGTVIPVHGHFLCVNAGGYSLASYPAGSGAGAAGDASYTTDIPLNAGIAIFNNNSGGGSYSAANRLDAVGSDAEANTLYKEGLGYPSISASTTESSWARRTIGACTGSSGNCGTLALTEVAGAVATSALADSHDNASDFVFVDTAAAALGAGQRLGAPGPENLSSPISRDGAFTLTSAKLDACAALQSAPNLVRDPTPRPDAAFGTLDIRRAFTNTSGAAITRLRFRIVDITTFLPPSSVADFRTLTSAGVTVTVDRPPCGTGTSSVSVTGTTLETPPSQASGGGYNSSLSVSSISNAMPLASGSSISVHFVLGVQQAGAGRFCVMPETIPAAAVEPFCFIGGTEATSAFTSADGDSDRLTGVIRDNRGTDVWNMRESSTGYASSAFVIWGGPGYTAVPGVYSGATGGWSILLSSGNYATSLTKNWGGSG